MLHRDLPRRTKKYQGRARALLSSPSLLCPSKKGRRQWQRHDAGYGVATGGHSRSPRRRVHDVSTAKGLTQSGIRPVVGPAFYLPACIYERLHRCRINLRTARAKVIDGYVPREKKQSYTVEKSSTME
jgi:hypothetical protein